MGRLAFGSAMAALLDAISAMAAATCVDTAMGKDTAMGTGSSTRA